MEFYTVTSTRLPVLAKALTAESAVPCRAYRSCLLLQLKNSSFSVKSILILILWSSYMCLDICLWFKLALVLVSVGETTAPKRRVIMLIAVVFSWGSGIVALSGFGYWLRNWKYLQLAISIPPIVLAPLVYWYSSLHLSTNSNRYNSEAWITGCLLQAVGRITSLAIQSRPIWWGTKSRQ